MQPIHPNPPRLQAEGLSATLPTESGKVCVLNALALHLEPGELVDLTGPSGSGKTMLLRALARLLPDQQGRLRLDGQDATQIPPPQWRTQVALVPQKPVLVPGSVAFNLRLPWTFDVRSQEAPPSDESLRQCLANLGLDELALDRDVARLSVGQQARVAFSRVLLTQPKVLLLDEVDAALDEDSALRIRNVLHVFLNQGGSILRSRHRRADGLATRRLHLEGGAIQEVAP